MPDPAPPSAAVGPDGVVVRASGMTKTFGGRLAVDGVDVEIRRGRVHALLGANGAGKSTLVSMLCGHYRPDAGTLVVGGVPRGFRSPRDALGAGIGVVHQDFRLVGSFTVLENVVLGTSDRAGRAAAERVRTLAARLGFGLDVHARAAGLAVGERQQTEILKLLYRGLDVLVLDEPTAVLTPQQSEQLFAALRTLAAEGKAVVFVSHRLREVSAVADHLTVLRDGRVVADRPAAGLDARAIAELMVGDVEEPAATRAAGTPAEPVLTLEEISAGPGGRDSLERLSLTVRGGELVGVAGVSGNGQRLLAEVAAGMTAPASGRRDCRAAAVGFIPEDRLATGLVGSMSVARNLALRHFRDPRAFPRAWVSPRRLRERAMPLVRRHGVPTDDPAVPAASLSGGGQQRLVLARELDDRPGLLVASQPTRGLDVASAAAVRARLLDACAAGSGVLVVSEDLDELLALCDRILVLVAGEFVAEVPRAAATRALLGAHMTGAAAPEGST